jgi:hypothetical protein
MEILIFINLCPNTQRTPANKFYNKTIIQELKAFSFGWGLRRPSAGKTAGTSPSRKLCSLDENMLYDIFCHSSISLLPSSIRFFCWGSRLPSLKLRQTGRPLLCRISEGRPLR